MKKEMRTNDFVRRCLYKANEFAFESDFTKYGYWMTRAHAYEQMQERYEDRGAEFININLTL